MKTPAKFKSKPRPRPSDATATTERQWRLLSELEQKRWQGASHLHEQLMLAGFDVSLRTVQRDLNALAKRFPIEKKASNPQGWRWRDDAPVQSLPHMTLSQAVAFRMMEDNLSQLLPPTVLDELLPWFDMARQQLKDSKIKSNWLSKVRIEPATQPLLAPKIDRACKDAIYDALFRRKQLHALYSPRGKLTKDYELNPLAVVQRGVVIYLLATKTDDDEQIIRTFALHRFKQVVVTDNTAVIPDGFDLNEYLDAGGMGFAHPLFKDLPKHGKQTKIKLVFCSLAGATLLESRLSTDQRVITNDDGTQTVNATVNLTSQLVWWLRGFGSKLVHIEPDILAAAVRQTNDR